MAGPAWLILPTYNEAENLEPLVLAARAALQRSAPEEGFRVLVVDDASPDGTGAIADDLAARFEEVRVLHRAGKEGLGRAYVAGFDVALREGAGYVMEMDSDFSHDPDDLPRLLAAARDGADLVLGSRYVPGGGVPEWPLLRRAVSRGGCWYARRVLGLPQRDLTGGFKCFRRATLEGIELPSVRSEGYAFQIELTYRAVQRGFRVVEVPITFHERREGTSKMSGRIALEAILRVPQMRG
ncbi:MAG: polyprenol monophosphomannose synthase [Actinomycetota bacterium]|nr:polyprenol monophosphomannose synthase [Actinomycetota bacterium]